MHWYRPLAVIRHHRYSLLLALALLIAWPGAAWCHAHPEQRTPAAEAKLEQAPKQVTILFSEALEPAFSSVKVTDDQGQSVNQGDSQVGADDPHLLVAPLQALEPGTYTVHWHAVSVDGHTTDGEYTFQVVAPGE